MAYRHTPYLLSPAEALREAFLHTDERQVDKIGCINFNGAQYEVDMKLIGRKVEVLYDTTWLDEVEIHHKDFEPFRAKKLVIGENCQSTKVYGRSLRSQTAYRSEGILYLSESQLTPRWFYNGLLQQLGSEPKFQRGDAKLSLHRQLEYIREVRHIRVVTIVDEAQWIQ